MITTDFVNNLNKWKEKKKKVTSLSRFGYSSFVKNDNSTINKERMKSAH